MKNVVLSRRNIRLCGKFAATNSAIVIYNEIEQKKNAI